MLPCLDHGRAGNAHGYASAYFQGKYTMVHRKVYCQHNGVTLASIEGQVVRHTCDNKRCKEPTHLLLGSQADNIADTIGKTGSTVRAVLTNEDVTELRRLFAIGATRKELAARFGVSYQSVKQIILGVRR